MIYLIDKKLVPGTGLIRFQGITAEELTGIVKIGLGTKTLDCRIVDKDTVDILRQITQQNIPLCPFAKVNREITLGTGDVIIMANVIVLNEMKQYEKPSGIKLEKVQMNAIAAYYFDYTPSGVVACVIDTQIASGIDKKEWYREFRDLLVKASPERKNKDEIKEDNLQIVQ